MAISGQHSPTNPLRWNGFTIAGIAVFSAVYFADFFLKAAHKCFWFDELFTVYLCRLPHFSDTWTAVTHGTDFNPPLFYLLIRGAQRLFGDGLVATRLPAIVGVWLFCFCLFLFVARRVGVVSGFIAGAFPLFTLVQYYAYEARAHGTVLGWCGLALLCWQGSDIGRARYLWGAGFGLSLIGALLTHVYAVYLIIPFALVEAYSLLRKSEVDWALAGVMVVVPIAVILAVYLPLFRGYRTIMPTVYFPVSHDLIQRFLVNAVGPAVVILLLWVALSALGATGVARNLVLSAAIPQREKVVAGGFACIPLFGLLGCKVTHGPFIDRYFLSSIAGYAILLGFASASQRVRSEVAKALAACMLVLIFSDLGTTAYLSIKQRIVLTEPSTNFRLSTTPREPMKLYDTLSMSKPGLDILVLPSLEYIYFYRYAPAAVVSRLYYAAPENDINRGGYEKLEKWAGLTLNTLTVDQFLIAHKDFLVYENGTTVHAEEMECIARAGYRLISAKADAAGVMYEYAK